MNNKLFNEICGKYELKNYHHKMLELMITAYEENKKIIFNMPRWNGKAAILKAYKEYKELMKNSIGKI